MGLFSKNPNGGIMDAIRCDEKSYLIWKWRPEGSELGESNRENTIRWGSTIRVRDGAVAAFVYSGKTGLVQDFIKGPADTTVDVKNLPVIASALGLLYNGSSPFQAEVYFINLAETIQIKFGVPYFEVYDNELPEYSVPVAVRGNIEFNIQDYACFINKNGLNDFSLDDLKKNVKESVAQMVKSVVANAPDNYGIRVIHIEKKITDIKEECIGKLREKFESDYGIYLNDINISALEINKDSEGYRELKAVTKDLTGDTLKAKARLGIKDMAADQKLGVFGRAANMFVDIKETAYARHKQIQEDYAETVENERAGFIGAAGAKIINALAKKDAAATAVTPPPVPSVKYFVAENGESTGPFELKTLRKMAATGRLTKNTLVWTEGMDDWAEAADIEAFKSLFANTSAGPAIPPIPKK